MNRLRTRLYLALLPLQLLLVGLAIWTLFFLNSLESLIQQAQQRHSSLTENIDNAVMHINEIELALNLVSGIGSRLLKTEIQEAAEAYFQAIEKIVNQTDLESSTKMRDMQTINQQLHSRIESLTHESTDRSEIDKLSEARLASEIKQLLAVVEIEMARLSIINTSQILALQDAFRKRIFISFVVIGSGMVLGVLGTLLISYQIGRMILDPLLAMQEKVKEVAGGNLNTQVHIKNRDEIGILANSFNQMLRRLREYSELTDQRLISTTRTFRSLLQRSPQAVFFLRQDMETYYANPEAEELLGVPEFNAGLPSVLTEFALNALNRKNIFVQKELDEALRIQTHGQVRFFLASAFPIDLVNTESEEREFHREEGIALMLQDVTLIKLSDNLKSSVVATVSHELKTPLTSARMSLYLLAEQQVGSLNENQMELVTMAKEDLERQLATIQNLLDLSKFEKRGRKLKRKPCLANEIIQKSASAYRELAKASEVELVVNPSHDNPGLLAEEKMIEVVLNNFLSNGLRHSPEGAKLELSVKVEGDFVVFSVADEGPGIPESDREIIFERFAQGKTGTKAGSAGLGLHIAKEIVEEHDGEIGCVPRNVKGTTFFFNLKQHHVAEASLRQG